MSLCAPVEQHHYGRRWEGDGALLPRKQNGGRERGGAGCGALLPGGQRSHAAPIGLSEVMGRGVGARVGGEVVLGGEDGGSRAAGCPESLCALEAARQRRRRLGGHGGIGAEAGRGQKVHVAAAADVDHAGQDPQHLLRIVEVVRRAAGLLTHGAGHHLPGPPSMCRRQAARHSRTAAADGHCRGRGVKWHAPMLPRRRKCI